MNIILIGFRGTGKTVAGKLVAQELGWEFIDADDHLQKKAGKTIKEIFAQAGEKGFRDMEEEVVAELAGLDHKVIAAGGGAVLRQTNVNNMKKSGIIILLGADAQTIYQRLLSDPRSTTQRPSLTNKDSYSEILHLLCSRRPYYERAADHRIDTTGLTPEAVAQEIISFYKQKSA